jgi:DNA-binding CsgD family transcriptional regulator
VEKGHAPSPSLLRRGDELARLGQALEDAVAGRGSLVVVTGPPGIGKTSLLRAVLEQAPGAGVRARRARGSELERSFPLGVVRQLLELPLAEASPDVRAELLEGAEAAAVALDPRAMSAPDGDSSFAIAHAIYWLTANLAARQPLLLVVDDAHWADPASLRVLAHLAARLEDLPLALVIGQRDADPEADYRLLGALSAGAAAVLRPPPLDDAATGALLEAALGEAPDAAFTTACRRVTGGNPFLLGELAGALRADGVVPRGDHVSEVEAVAPSTVAHTVLLRLGRLPRDCVALARAVAVLGTGVGLEDAASLAGLEDAAAAAAADELVAAAVLAPSTELEFLHPVLRTVVYEDLGPGERGRLHAAAWSVLAARPGRSPAELAPHGLAIAPRGDPEVARTLMAAGIDALSRGAPVEAGKLLRRALAEPPPDPDRVRLLELAGQADLYTSDGAGAIAHLRETARLTRDDALRTHCLLTIARMIYSAQGAQPAVAALDAAIAGPLQGIAPELAVRVEADRQAMALQHESTAASADAAIPATTDDPFTACTVASQALLRADDAERAVTAGRLVFGPRGVPTLGGLQTMAMYQPVTALAYADDLEAARAAATGLVDASRRETMMSSLIAGLVQLAIVQTRAGELAGAEADARAAVDLPGVMPAQAQNASAWLALILLARGEVDAAADAVAVAAPALAAPPAVQHHVALAAHAGVLRAQGDVAGASASYAEYLGRQRRARVRTPWPWRLDAIRAFLADGDEPSARAEAARLEEDGNRWGAVSSRALALRARALVEDGAAVALLREALALLDGRPTRLEQARCELELGAALRRAGERTEARHVLAVGLDRAHACGALGLVSLAHEELVVAGARPRRLQFSGVDALTAAERRVAELAAGGLSNRVIAQQLYVTPKTVENQLGRVYGKLGITSRAELASALGVVPA